MTETFKGMDKINELSEELLKQLERYRDSVHGDLSYADYDDMNQRSREYEEKGWDRDSARDQASRDKEQADWEDEELQEITKHLSEIGDAIRVLKKLTIKKD